MYINARFISTWKICIKTAATFPGLLGVASSCLRHGLVRSFSNAVSPSPPQFAEKKKKRQKKTHTVVDRDQSSESRDLPPRPVQLDTQGDWPARCGTVKSWPKTLTRCAIVIDGDVCGPKQWPAVLKAAREYGNITHIQIIGWKSLGPSELERLAGADVEVEIIDVPRKAGGGKDPGDIALGVHVTRLVSTGRADAIALVVQDVDYLYLVKCLKRWGHEVLLLRPQGAMDGLANVFRDSGAIIVEYGLESPAGPTVNSKWRAVLLNNGVGEMVPLSEDHPSLKSVIDFRLLRHFLIDLAYLESEGDPLVPAIAKFFFVNALGPVSVFPQPVCYFEALAMITRHPHRRWVRNPGDLAFALPVRGTSKGKKQLQIYGSAPAGQVFRGGGPFVLRDSGNLTRTFLQKLAYLDDTLNIDAEEAVDIFWRNGGNTSIFKSVGIVDQVWSALVPSAKEEVLRSVLLSPRIWGGWTWPRQDVIVRSMLLKEGRIKRLDASNFDVFSALQACAADGTIPRRNTYNGLVHELLEISASSDPAKRK